MLAWSCFILAVLLPAQRGTGIHALLADYSNACSCLILLQHHMHFNLAHPEIQDDFVLEGLPAGLRRGVLKELYVKRLQGTRTFKVVLNYCNMSDVFCSFLMPTISLHTL